MRHKGLLLAAAAAAMLTLPALTPAGAQTVSRITEVQYAEYPGYYVYDGPPLLDIPGRVIGDTAVVASGVAGVPYGYYRTPYAGTGVVYAENGVAACARRFRSFDPATGTYTSYTGEQVVCPYLGG
jgi:BA14K-like protein